MSFDQKSISKFQHHQISPTIIQQVAKHDVEFIERLKRLLNGSPSQPLGPKPCTALAQAAAKETKRHEEDRRNEVLLLFFTISVFFLSFIYCL